MPPERARTPDWRDAEAYAALAGADRSIFGWEWLRRDPSYREAAERALEAAPGRRAPDKSEAPEHWGLHAFEPPHLAAPDARPVWRADIHPYVLKVQADRPIEAPDSFELSRLGMDSIIVTSPDGQEHLLITDGLRAIRIDVLAGTLTTGPVQLRYRLAGFASAERPLLTLRRFLALWRTGRFSDPLHPAQARARRFVLMLRAHDASASGATQREIAAELLSGEAEEARWRTNVPSVRSRVQRLVRNAQAMAAGGYRSLLV